MSKDLLSISSVPSDIC